MTLTDRFASIIFAPLVCLLLGFPATSAATTESSTLAMPVASTYSSCMGNCCHEISRAKGGAACVRRLALPTTLPPTDHAASELGTPLSYRLVTGRWSKKETRSESPLLYGLADDKNRIILQPVYTNLIPVSAHHAVTNTGLVEIRSGKEAVMWSDTLRMPMVFASYDVTTESEVPLNNGKVMLYNTVERSVPAIISVTAERSAGQSKLCDTVFISHSGALGRQLDNIVCNSRPEIYQLGKRLVFKTRYPGEPERYVFTDSQGTFVASAEAIETLRRYKLSSYELTNGRGTNPGTDSTGSEVLVRIGRFPEPFDSDKDGLYQPIDADGNPVELDPDVLGLMPIRVMNISYMGDLHAGWMIIETADNGELRFRPGTGTATGILAQRHELPVLDRLIVSAPLLTEKNQSNRVYPHWHQQNQLLGRLEESQQWVALDRENPAIDLSFLKDLWRRNPTENAVCGGAAWELPERSSRILYTGGTHACIGISADAILSARATRYQSAVPAAAMLLTQARQAEKKLAFDHAQAQAEKKAAARQVAINHAKQLAGSRSYTWGDVEYSICPTLGEQSPECRAGRQKHPVQPPPAPPSIQQIFNQNIENYKKCQEARRNAARVERSKGTQSVSGYVWVNIPECRNFP